MAQAVPLIIAAASTAISTAQKQSQLRSQAKIQQAAINRQIQQRNMEREIREEQQREQQKQQQASARARFGGRGVSSTHGSAGAVLDGIAARTDEVISDNRRLSDFGIETLRENQRAIRRQNMLEQRNNIMNSVVGLAKKGASAYFGSSVGS